MTYAILASIMMAFISFLGVTVFQFKVFRNNLKYFLAISSGALLANAFVHILPEAVESKGLTIPLSLTFLGAVSFNFVIDSYLRYKECCEVDSNQKKHLGVMNLIGDGLCNLTDGIEIAASFIASPATGVATTIAIIMHEIPQEITDFATMLHAGFSQKSAIIWNFVISLIALVGVVLGTFAISQVPELKDYLLVFAAGSLTYLSLSNLIPEIHESHKHGFSWKILGFYFCGLTLVTLVKFLEPGH